MPVYIVRVIQTEFMRSTKLTKSGPTPVRLAALHERVLNQLVADGVYKTRSETVRAALLLLAEKHDLVKRTKVGK